MYNHPFPSLIAFYIIPIIGLLATQNQQPIIVLCKAVANKMAGQKTPCHFLGSMHGYKGGKWMQQHFNHQWTYTSSQHPTTANHSSTFYCRNILQKRLCNFATRYFPVIYYNCCNIISPIERHPRNYNRSQGLNSVHLPAF